MKMSGGLGGGATQMSAMESMKEVFLEIRDNTKETVELLKTAVMGDPAQNKRDKISRGDTDKEEKEPGILSKVGTTLGKLNPFGGGGMLDTLGKLVLAVGGIALLKIFGDKAVGPLADLIESIKKGKISENISKAYEYVKEVGVNAFEELRTNTILFIDGVKKVYGILEGAYKAVQAYVMSFDTTGAEHPAGKQFGMIDEGDGKLDSKEMEALRSDLVTKATDFIKDMFKELTFGIGSLLTQTAFLASGASLAMSALKGPLLGGAGIGAVGVIGIGLMLANAILKTYENIQFAMEEAVQDDGTIDYKQFAASFLGGQKEGSWRNAFKQSSLLGGTFSGIGIAIGMVGGPVGMLIGGVIGYFVGSVIGLITGKMGSDKIKKMFDKFGLMINDTVDVIGNFFTDLAVGFKAIASFRNPMKAIRENRLKDKDRLEGDLNRKERELEKYEADQKRLKDHEIIEGGLITPEIKATLMKNNEEKIKELNEEIEKTKKDVVVAPTLASSTELSDIDAEIEMNRLQLQFENSQFGGPDKKDLDDIDAAYKILVDRRLELIKILSNIKNTMPSIELDKQSVLIEDRKSYGAAVAASNLSVGNTIKTNSDNNKVENHSHGAGLMSSLTFPYSSKVLASKGSSGVPGR